MGDRDWHIPTVQTEVRVPQYKAGDRVLLLQPRKKEKESATKFHVPLWTGPYLVLRKISDLVYVIDNHGKSDEVHVNRMKLQRERKGELEWQGERMMTREKERRMIEKAKRGGGENMEDEEEEEEDKDEDEEEEEKENNDEEEESEDDEDEGEFEVEEIRDKRERRRSRGCGRKKRCNT